MKPRATNLRKAAILVASLDERNAALLLAQLAPQQAALVKREVAALDHVAAAERELVLEEFFRIGSLVPERDASGIELTGPLARQLATPGPWAEMSDPPVKPTAQRPARFGFLQHADWELLAPLLENEHPQTIAVISAHLPHEHAARLLTALRPAIQVEVMRRLADLDEMDLEILAEIESQLEAWIAREQRSRQRRRVGLDAVSGILDAADSGSKQILLSNLRRHDLQLAERLTGDAPPAAARPTFHDLLELEPAPLTTLLQHAEPELFTLALADADRATVDRLCQRLPSRDAHRLQRELALRGPTRLSDVEAAQQELVRLAEQLEKQKRITLRRRRLSLAA